MSLFEWRGGFPVVFRGSVASDGVVTDSRSKVFAVGDPIVLGAHQKQQDQDGRSGPITAKWVRIVNLDATNGIRVYFSQNHFTDNVHYVTLEAGSLPTSIWEGPAEVREIWLRSEAGTPLFDITAFRQRA